MINLLPPNEKKQLRAARANVLLLRYNFLVLGALIFLVIGLSAVYIYLTAQKQAAELTIQENSKREVQYSAVKADAEKFRSELASAKNILNSQVSYSRALIRVSALFPEGTVLQDRLDLTESISTAPLAIAVKVKNEDAAQAVLKSFQSSQYVSSAIKDSIGIGDSDYPYVMNMRVLFKKEILAP